MRGVPGNRHSSRDPIAQHARDWEVGRGRSIDGAGEQGYSTEESANYRRSSWREGTTAKGISFKSGRDRHSEAESSGDGRGMDTSGCDRTPVYKSGSRRC